MTKIITTTDSKDTIERIDQEVKIGQWYWVGTQGQEPKEHWLGCVSAIGSNYVRIQSPRNSENRSYYDKRVLIDEMHLVLTLETNPLDIINKKIESSKQLINEYLNEIQNITQRLGINNHLIGHQVQSPSRDLMVMSSSSDIKGYEKALIKAKDIDLPKLYESVKSENATLAYWMSAEALPLKFQAETYKQLESDINDQIFNVSLYAGLIENVVQCKDGEPAEMSDQLHVMQRKIYADEECLLSYQDGGIEIGDLPEFDKWLSQDENFNRILPFPRTIVAMQVRRKDKVRPTDGSIFNHFVNLRLENADRTTFLLVRNGGRLYRINTELDFDELIFPDVNLSQTQEPLMVNVSNDRIRGYMTVREYDELVKQKSEEHEWAKANPDKGFMDNPHRMSFFYEKEWAPYDQSNVYYDDISKDLADNIKKHNRIALIIQGLFDRSEMLHPHPPIKTWDPDSFANHIKLISDGANVLHYREAPDFEQYRLSLNALIDKSSVVIGQETVWLIREAERECNRRDRDWRDTSTYRPEYYSPYGDPGPGYMAFMKEWKPKARKAIFSWYRKGRSEQTYGKYIRSTITVDASELFNVSAYKPGDFKLFFEDPRTRQEYIKWAPILLTAEAYYAGKRQPRKPDRNEDNQLV